MLCGAIIGRGAATALSDVGPAHLLAALDRLNVMLLRILLHAENPRLVKLPLQLLLSCQLNKSELNTRVNLGGLHMPLGGLKLEDHSSGPVTKVLLEFMHCI